MKKNARGFRGYIPFPAMIRPAGRAGRHKALPLLSDTGADMEDPRPPKGGLATLLRRFWQAFFRQALPSFGGVGGGFCCGRI